MTMIQYTKDDFTLGQEVILRYINNQLRNEKKKEAGFCKAVVTKLGRKYVTVKPLENASSRGLYEVKFNLETGYNVTEFSPDYQIFPTEHDYKSIVTREENLKEIRKFFAYIFGDVPMSNTDIQAIATIIKLRNEEQ